KMRPQRYVLRLGAPSAWGASDLRFSSHSRCPSVTASDGFDRYDDRMQIRLPKPKQEQHTLAIRKKTAAVSIDLRIMILRRERVILDTALAELYNVSVKRLNEQAK